jgi:hypothetical protein
MSYEDGAYIKNKMTKEEFEIHKKTVKPHSGKCVRDSFITWQKLRNIGARRMRGMHLMNENIIGGNGDETSFFHCWVEAKGLVYNVNDYQVNIMPIQNYYAIFQPFYIEEADDGIFTTNNSKLMCGPDKIHLLEEWLINGHKVESVKR